VKIRILSDLHLEFQLWTPPQVDADVVVLAGDIHVGSQGIEWARRHFAPSPVVYVPGNHEFYGEHMQNLRTDLLREGRDSAVDVLDGHDLVIGGARFLGATLWTDFALHGADLSSIDRAMADADSGMNDFRLIGYGERGRFLPENARAIHLAQVRWLRIKLAEKFPGPTIVVTHHLPHRHSIHLRYKGSGLNPSFASDLSDLMGPSVPLWIHGHTHDSFDYVVNGTRVVCNPRGYAPMALNPEFKPDLTVDLHINERARTAVGRSGGRVVVR
jgi:predicted phosphodiesterase